MVQSAGGFWLDPISEVDASLTPLPFDDESSDEEHEDRGSQTILPLASNDPPLPWRLPKQTTQKTGRAHRSTIKFVKELETLLFCALMTEHNQHITDYLIGHTALAKTMSEISSSSIPERLLEETEKMRDSDIYCLVMVKDAFAPLTEKTSLETIIDLGTTWGMIDKEGPLSQLELSKWFNGRTQEDHWWMLFLLDCLLPKLLMDYPLGGKSKWALKLVEYLIDKTTHADTCEEFWQTEDDWKEAKMDEAALLAIGFVVCLEELSEVNDDCSDDAICNSLLEECRAQAFYTLLQHVLNLTRRDDAPPAEWGENKKEEVEEIKDFVLDVLYYEEGHTDSARSDKDENEDRNEEMMDIVVIKAINKIGQKWHDARRRAIEWEEQQPRRKNARDQATEKLIEEVKTKLAVMEQAKQSQFLKGSLYDREMAKLQERCYVAFFYALRKGILSPKGFHSLLVVYMQQMKYASLEFKMIIRLAQRDARWEIWQPWNLTEHLQGLQALHQYWRKSQKGKNFTKAMEMAIITKLCEMTRLIADHIRRVHSLLQIAKEATQGSVSLMVEPGKLLRFDAETTVRLLKYVRVRAKDMKQEAKKLQGNSIRANFSFQCFNLALALLWDNESTEEVVLHKTISSKVDIKYDDNDPGFFTIDGEKFTSLTHQLKKEIQEPFQFSKFGKHEDVKEQIGQLKFMRSNFDDSHIMQVLGQFVVRQNEDKTFQDSILLLNQLKKMAVEVCSINARMQLEAINCITGRMLPQIRKSVATESDQGFLALIIFGVRKTLMHLGDKACDGIWDDQSSQKMIDIDQLAKTFSLQYSAKEKPEEKVAGGKAQNSKSTNESAQALKVWAEQLVTLFSKAIIVYYSAKNLQVTTKLKLADATFPKPSTREYVTLLQGLVDGMTCLREEAKETCFVDAFLRMCPEVNSFSTEPPLNSKKGQYRKILPKLQSEAEKRDTGAENSTQAELTETARADDVCEGTEKSQNKWDSSKKQKKKGINKSAGKCRRPLVN